MPRITVRVDEDTAEWLDAEADRLDRSKAKTGGRCIELLHSEVDHIKPQHFDAVADINLMQADSDRVNELEQRLSDVEARVSDLEAAEPRHAHASGGADDPDDQRGPGGQESLSAASSASQHAPDAGGSTRVDESTDSVRAQAEKAAQGVDIPGRNAAAKEARREALLWAWEYLREQGRAQSSEIANATFDAFDADDLGYSAQEKYRGRGLWQGYLRDALRELPSVDGPGPKGRIWDFVED